MIKQTEDQEKEHLRSDTTKRYRSTEEEGDKLYQCMHVFTII